VAREGHLAAEGCAQRAALRLPLGASTQSIPFGDLDELRERARHRVEKLHAQGITDAYLEEGISGALWKTFKTCTVAGLALSLWSGRQRWKTVATSALTTAGALALRASARDPQATFRSQRDGLGGAEVGATSQVLRDDRPERFPLPVVR
jgi:hypothetical protein